MLKVLRSWLPILLNSYGGTLRLPLFDQIKDAARIFSTRRHGGTFWRTSECDAEPPKTHQSFKEVVTEPWCDLIEISSVDNDNNNEFSLIDLNNLKGLKVACLNINSLLKHIDELRVLMLNNSLDILAVNESKINESISDDEISISGFHLIRKGDIYLGISDHSLVFTVRKFVAPKSWKNVRYVRNFKNFDTTAFLNDLSQMPWENVTQYENPNLCWQLWKSFYLQVLNRHAPFRRMRIRGNSLPWITPNIKNLMRARDFHKKKAAKFNSQLHWAKYKGDKGDVGPQGPKGDKGDPGLSGPKGLQGVQGLTGPRDRKGDKGDKSDKGDKGDKGDAGSGGLTDAGFTMKAGINMGNHKVTNLGTPTTNADAATKKYVDDKKCKFKDGTTTTSDIDLRTSASGSGFYDDVTFKANAKCKDLNILSTSDAIVNKDSLETGRLVGIQILTPTLRNILTVPTKKELLIMKGKPTSNTIIYKYPSLNGNPTMTKDSDSVTLDISFTSNLPKGIYKYIFDLYFSATKSLKVFLYGECGGVGYKSNTIYEHWNVTLQGNDTQTNVNGGFSIGDTVGG